MNQILNKVRDVDPNNSDAVKDVLSPFFQNLSKHIELDCYKWLHTLESVINRFPKYCMFNRTNIEAYLTHFLDSSNYYNVIAAAKCAHALQQVRPSQEKTATAKTCWREQMNDLCNAAHLLVSTVFPNAVDIYKNSGKVKEQQPSQSSPLSAALTTINTIGMTQSKNVLNKHTILTTRLRNVFVFIQAMLVEIYPVAKPIRPQTILDVIVRALSVSSCSNPTGGQTVSDVSTVKTQALRTIDALVACLGPNLISYSPLIFRFVMQTLKWTSDNPSNESSKLRCVAYKTVSLWMDTLVVVNGAPDRGRCWEEQLAEHVIGDVTPSRHVMQLTMSAKPSKHLSKKAKRKLANTMLQESNISSHMPGERNKVVISEEMNDEVAIAALECTETFLTVCGVFLKPTTHKRFQERLVRECFNMASYSSQRGLRLLRALHACRAAPPGVAPCTQYCLQLYSALATSDRGEISRFCTQALLDIRLHLHCSPPTLSFALVAQPEAKKQKEETKKKISDRNRAALEALLGHDKVPTMDKEDIITIADEPSNKKPRLEDEEADKISLSSESHASVEISDDDDDEEVELMIIENDKDDEQTEENETNQPVELDEIDSNEDKQKDVADTTQEQDNDVQNLDTKLKNASFYEAATQLPLNTSNDTIDDVSPVSMEVAYDYPNTGKEKVTVLEKIDDENLPSTNETDDIQITCGQVVKYSQEVVDEKKSDIEKQDVPKVNGVAKAPVMNGVSDVNNDIITVKEVPENGVTVEDMLADFVDEVVDDNNMEKTQA